MHVCVPHHYIDKLNSDMCSYVIFILCGFWMSIFSLDASGKYCICKATVVGPQFCKNVRIPVFFSLKTDGLKTSGHVCIHMILGNSFCEFHTPCGRLKKHLFHGECQFQVKKLI